MNFPVDNKQIKTAVDNMLSSGKIPHAILIEGGTEEDRGLISDYLCMSAVCEGENIPCGMCDACRLFKNSNHPDIKYIAPEKGKKSIPVSAAREIIADSAILPQRGRRKIFVIEKAETLNINAQNALLKTLEEPPESSVFILKAVSRSALLETVVSRCAVLTLSTKIKPQTKFDLLAEDFIKATQDGGEYELLKILFPLEKSRIDTACFYDSLEIALVNLQKNCKSSTLIQRYDNLYNKVLNHKELLNTNPNLSLLLSDLALSAAAER